MLYQLREAQRALLTPIAAWAGVAARLYDAPHGPLSYAPFARSMSAWLELVHRVGRDYPKPSFGIDSVDVDGAPVPVTIRVAKEKPFCRLVRFEKQRGPGATAPTLPKVLVVAPLSGHHATLVRDTLRTLLPDHEVWVTDWVDARLVPLAAGPFGLDDYTAYVIDFMRELGPDLHVMAVCQPVVPVLGAVSILSTIGDEMVPRSMTLMGGPIDARRSQTKVNELATTRRLEWFRDNLIHQVPSNHPGAGRRVYPGFLQLLAFVSMNPSRHAAAHAEFFRDALRGDVEQADAHRAFYDEYNAVLDMDERYYLDTVKLVFQEHALARGAWDVRFEGRTIRVDPSAISATALLTVEGELDDVAGLGQTAAAHDLCTSIAAERRHHHLAKGAGHYGIFSGSRWRESIYPVVRAFIRDA